MRDTRISMGMPITVEIVDQDTSQKDFDSVFDYFDSIDNRFSTYKRNSEISQFNRGEITQKDLSLDIKEIFRLSELTRNQTEGFFNIKKMDGTIDPSGLVKGWAIRNAAAIIMKKGYKNFYIDAGGDIQVSGKNALHKKWSVGIKNPFNEKKIVKIVYLTTEGIATSGSYIRGSHIYNPNEYEKTLDIIVSFTVIGPNVYEADRFATAAYAMQEKGIYFIERQKGLEGYMIDRNGFATMTSGFEKYV